MEKPFYIVVVVAGCGLHRDSGHRDSRLAETLFAKPCALSRAVLAEGTNIISLQLRVLRVAAGMTQADLAAKLQLLGCDIGPKHLSKIENRMRGVSDFEIAAIAVALKCSPAALFPTTDSALKAAIRRQAD